MTKSPLTDPHMQQWLHLYYSKVIIVHNSAKPVIFYSTLIDSTPQVWFKRRKRTQKTFCKEIVFSKAIHKITLKIRKINNVKRRCQHSSSRLLWEENKSWTPPAPLLPVKFWDSCELLFVNDRLKRLSPHMNRTWSVPCEPRPWVGIEWKS